MEPVKRGEVWRVAFDLAAGGEIRKTRPAVIVSNNAANAVLNRVVVVPLSRQTGRIYRGEVRVRAGGFEAKAMADQITAAAKPRLRGRLDAVSPEDLRAIEAAILLHLGIRRLG